MSYIDNIVKFHTFSKSTVRENLTLGEAVNPSGHTVTAKQIRTQDIPAFIYSFQTSETDALTWAAGNIDAHVRHNDILYWGSQFNMGFEIPNCLIRVAKLEDENGKVIGELPSGTEPYWEPFNLNDETVLRNSVGDPVITIHKGCKISYVHDDNNAAVNSNKFAAFVKTNDGRLLDHFISPTDQIIGGQPSLGYNLLLFKDGQDKALTEGEEIGKDNYIANAYAGIIHFMDERTETHDASKNYEVSGFNVYCYEYTGNKLDSMLTESTAELKDYVDNEINKAIEYRTVNITEGTDNIEIEYKDTTDGDGNPGTYTISVDGYTTSEIDAIKDDINGALDDHIDDTTIHVTDDDKSRWNEAEELLDEHTNDSTIHVTGNDKSRWNEAEELLDEHIVDSTIHVTSDDKSRWNEAEELLNEHIIDDNKHITEEDRERWDKGGSAIQSITHDDFINAVGDGNIWDLSLNVASDITNDNQNLNNIKSSTVPTTAAVIERISDDIQSHAQMFAGHMPFEDQRHSMAGGDLRTLISEKIEPSNLYTFDRQPGGTGNNYRRSKIYFANTNAAFNGFIKEITFTNSSCDYNGDIYVKINENYPIDKYDSDFGRFIGIFKFESSRDGGLKVVFDNGFKVDSEHDYYFTFYNTSEIDKNSEDGNISLNLLATNDMGSNTPMFTGSGFRSWNTFSSKNRSNGLYYSNF